MSECWAESTLVMGAHYLGRRLCAREPAEGTLSELLGSYRVLRASGVTVDSEKKIVDAGNDRIRCSPRWWSLNLDREFIAQSSEFLGQSS